MVFRKGTRFPVVQQITFVQEAKAPGRIEVVFDCELLITVAEIRLHNHFQASDPKCEFGDVGSRPRSARSAYWSSCELHNVGGNLPAEAGAD